MWTIIVNKKTAFHAKNPYNKSNKNEKKEKNLPGPGNKVKYAADCRRFKKCFAYYEKHSKNECNSLTNPADLALQFI